jgi:hypothetical protein
MTSIYSAFTLLRQVYEALIMNFNEARVQVMPESMDTQSTGTGAGTMEGGRFPVGLAHPSRKELAIYYASGLPKYI